MSTLLSYFIAAIQKIVNKGMFLKLNIGSSSVTLYAVLVYILCFFALVFILKKLYRW